jgi:hypothetical protein
MTNKQIAINWADYRDSVLSSTPVDNTETVEQQRKRKAKLESNFEDWATYYFPKFAYAAPAPFHIKSSKRIINNLEWFEVRSWSRELAKSTRTMFEVLYLCLTGKKRYVLFISNNETNAGNLLEPYRIQLENNPRIIKDYGIQESIGKWTFGEFTTRKKCAFKAIGSGQSPRGTRNEEIRPDVIIFDDIDTDEDCRNPDIINKRWDWIENAAIGTRSISKETTIIFCGNLIAKDCCVVRAQKFADHVDIINIRDADGKSTWENKNSEAHIDRVLSQKSWESTQREYFNNPIENGEVFKEITYGKCPPLNQLPFAIIYADPSPSNKDRPSTKAKVQQSCKAVVIVGFKDFKFYVYKAFVDATTNSNFVDWLYTCKNYVGTKTQPFVYIENNTLQDPFYQQVLLPLIYEQGKASGEILGVTPDSRAKPDKYFRIEGTLEPINRQGRLILNIEEKENPHMQRLESQFKAVSANSKQMDGPDAVEGAVHLCQNKISIINTGDIIATKRRANPKRY